MPDRRENSSKELNYGEAVNHALRRLLEDFDNALVYGEDVAKPGGVFGVTRRLLREFGERVFDTPISEAAILGSAIGAAMAGMRPIVEIMWVDFSLVALDQLVNQAANVRYVSNGTLAAPITVRTQQGVLAGSCAQHSQSLEAIFAHIPGLRVAMPATPQDAYDILVAAVHCDDPTIVMENRRLYAGDRAAVTIGTDPQAIGGSATVRSGTDLTLVSYGAMRLECEEAARVLEQRGVGAEVIDLRWIAPWDREAVVASVARTKRCLVVHEANVTGGFGAEIAAAVNEDCFGDLAAPVVRVGVPDMRMPAAPVLQEALVPNYEAIAACAERLLEV